MYTFKMETYPSRFGDNNVTEMLYSKEYTIRLEVQSQDSKNVFLLSDDEFQNLEMVMNDMKHNVTVNKEYGFKLKETKNIEPS